MIKAYVIFSHEFQQTLAIIPIGLAIIVVSTCAIAYIKKASIDTEALFHNPKTVISDKVFVDKSARTLQLLSNNKVIKSYRSIHISYPNAADKAHAEALGINLGTDIMIHGQMNGFGHLA